MISVGFIGWRGMVGSVLMERMAQEDDFSHINSQFFSTSQVGANGPVVAGKSKPLGDAYDLAALSELDCIVTCQGGDYTSKVYQSLRNSGWNGYWIDAASTLRMNDDAVLLLDPINRAEIDRAVARGVRTFVGANCTVSLMLMAIGGLFREGLVEWVSSMTYQAASGAGAAVMEELIRQHEYLTPIGNSALSARDGALVAEASIRRAVADPAFPVANIGASLAFNVLPFIDKMVDGGQSREEWKGEVETNKILATSEIIPVDGICARVGALRCHSQGLTVKLREARPLAELEEIIASANEWVTVIPNDRSETISRLSPMAISGSLKIAVGRLHTLRMGPDYLGLFTIGDQLLWGAAEPLRRFLRILVSR